MEFQFELAFRLGLTRDQMLALYTTREYRRVRYYKKMRLAQLNEGDGGRTFLEW